MSAGVHSTSVPLTTLILARIETRTPPQQCLDSPPVEGRLYHSQIQ